MGWDFQGKNHTHLLPIYCLFLTTESEGSFSFTRPFFISVEVRDEPGDSAPESCAPSKLVVCIEISQLLPAQSVFD